MLINESGIAGQVIIDLNTNVTGSTFLSLLMIVFILLILFLLLRVPLEFSAIFILPMLIIFGSIDGSFSATLGVFLIYLGILLGKNFFFTDS